jgi:hypothetical protein
MAAPREPAPVPLKALTEALRSADPSAMTTAQLYREMLHSRELSDANFDAINKAIELTQQYPTLLDSTEARLIKQIEKTDGAVREVLSEKFGGVEAQFKERDLRNEAAASAGRAALDAAFSSQKEAIGKSEAAIAKQQDSHAAALQALQKSFDDKVSDLKDRLTAIEGRSQGIGASWGWLLGAVGLVGTVVALFIAFSPKPEVVTPAPIIIERAAPAAAPAQQ